MTPLQLKAFLTKHEMSYPDLAKVLGVQPAAVYHWLCGRRQISLTVSRLIRMFDTEPDLMKVFVA